MKLGIINGWEEGNIKYVSEKDLEAVEFCVNHNYNSADFLAKAPDINSYNYILIKHLLRKYEANSFHEFMKLSQKLL